MYSPYKYVTNHLIFYFLYSDESSGNVNVRAAFIHVLGDLLQSLGVLVAAFIIYFKVHVNIDEFLNLLTRLFLAWVQNSWSNLHIFLLYFGPHHNLHHPSGHCCHHYGGYILYSDRQKYQSFYFIIFSSGSPAGIEFSAVKEKLIAIEGVVAVHDLRIWSLTLNQSVLSCHLAIGKQDCKVMFLRLYNIVFFR